MKIIVFFLLQSMLTAQVFYSQGDPSKKEVSLTYDDGPSKTTPYLLDMLKKYNVKATFFVLGENVKKYPQYLKRIKEDGHLIGSHTYSHKNFYKYKNEIELGKLIEKEIMTSENEIKKVNGEKPSFLRYPYGYNKETGLDIASKLGYKVYNWTFGCDWDKSDDEKIINRYLAHIKPGAIFLIHDTGQKLRKERTLKITETLIQELNKTGYKIVRLDEMSFR